MYTFLLYTHLTAGILLYTAAPKHKIYPPQGRHTAQGLQSAWAMTGFWHSIQEGCVVPSFSRPVVDVANKDTSC